MKSRAKVIRKLFEALPIVDAIAKRQETEMMPRGMHQAAAATIAGWQDPYTIVRQSHDRMDWYCSVRYEQAFRGCLRKLASIFTAAADLTNGHVAEILDRHAAACLGKADWNAADRYWLGQEKQLPLSVHFGPIEAGMPGIPPGKMGFVMAIGTEDSYDAMRGIYPLCDQRLAAEINRTLPHPAPFVTPKPVRVHFESIPSINDRWGLGGFMHGGYGPSAWCRPEKRDMSLMAQYGAIALLFSSRLKVRYDGLKQFCTEETWRNFDYHDFVRFIAGHEVGHGAIRWPDAESRLGKYFQGLEEYKATLYSFLVHAQVWGPRSLAFNRAMVADCIMSHSSVSAEAFAAPYEPHKLANQLWLAHLMLGKVIENGVVLLAGTSEASVSAMHWVSEMMAKGTQADIEVRIQEMQHMKFPASLNFAG